MLSVITFQMHEGKHKKGKRIELKTKKKKRKRIELKRLIIVSERF